MPIKRINGNRRVLHEPIINPYESENSARNQKFLKDNGVKVLRGSLPKFIYKIGSYQKCCVCGFMHNKGVKTRSGFCCITDYQNPNIYMESKIILPNGIHINPKTSIQNWM